MRKMKIKSLNNSEAVTVYLSEPTFVEFKQISQPQSREFVPSPNRVHFSNKFSYSKKFGAIFSAWHDHISKVEINLNNAFDPSLKVLELCTNIDFEDLQPTVNELIEAVRDYKECQVDSPNTASISNASAKQFLYLTPVFATHKVRLYIDSSNGCLNVDVLTSGNEKFSTHIENNGTVHYSLIGRGNRLVKISGTAKFKDSRDLKEFGKVLKML